MSNDLIPQPNNSISKFLPSEEKELENDIAYARQNITTLIEVGISSVSQLSDIADQSQQSVAYERLSGLMKTVSELNKDLIDVGKIKKDLRQGTQGDSNSGNKTTNNLFVGSTAQMAEILKQMKNKE